MLRMPMFIKADNKLLKMLFVIYFEFLWILVGICTSWSSRSVLQYLNRSDQKLFSIFIGPTQFQCRKSRLNDKSFFKINIHLLAQFLHVERAYELRVFLGDSEARKHVISTLLAWISLATLFCRVFFEDVVHFFTFDVKDWWPSICHFKLSQCE